MPDLVAACGFFDIAESTAIFDVLAGDPEGDDEDEEEDKKRDQHDDDEDQEGEDDDPGNDGYSE